MWAGIVAEPLAVRVELLRASDAATAPNGLTLERTDWGFIERYEPYRDYFEGHRLVLDTPPNAVELASCIDRYYAIFPTRRKAYPAVLTWYDDLSADDFTAEGLSEHIGLVKYGAPARTSVNQPPAEVVASSSPGFWDNLLLLETMVYPQFRAFNKWRIGMFRELTETRRGAYYGIVQDGNLVAAAGACCPNEVGRFMSVVTAPDHRRRGLASFLLDYLINALGNESAMVIVAERGSQAERTYRACGFTPFISIRSVQVMPTSTA